MFRNSFYMYKFLSKHPQCTRQFNLKVELATITPNTRLEIHQFLCTLVDSAVLQDGSRTRDRYFNSNRSDKKEREASLNT